MTMRITDWLLIAGLSAVGPTAGAHHSTHEFDYTKAYLVEGEVVEVQWTNPHSWVHVLIPNASGGADRWNFESGAPLFNVRMGWKKDSVKRGQRVKVVFCPSSEPARGTLMQILLPDGTSLNGIAKNFYRGPEIVDIAALAAPPPLPRP